MELPSLLRIGTRASKLAIAQSEEVKRRLLAAYPEFRAEQIEILPMTTTGDRIQDKTLGEIGGKGLFTKEIEEALLSNTVDIAVHSMKDMPTQLPEGLMIACILEREDPRDALLSAYGNTLAALPEGARFGTSSLRRAAQVKLARPDIEIVPLRGNVQTRMQKLAEGVCDATMLAMAGLNRLGLDGISKSPLEVQECLPAIAQGAIGIECRMRDSHIIRLLEAIHHDQTGLCIAAERSLLTTLDGSCRTPIAGLATLNGNTLTLEGLVAKPDGSASYRMVMTTDARMKEARALGKALGEALLAQAGEGFLA